MLHQCRIFVTVSLQAARQSAIREAYLNVFVNQCVDVSMLVFGRMVDIFNICCNRTQGHFKNKCK